MAIATRDNKGRFEKGCIPWTKGKKGICFNTGRTHFKKGCITWNKGIPNPKFAEWNRINNPIRTGKDHPRWKSGVTSKDRLERVKFQHTIQKQVFERDNYTCQLCGLRGADLQVDHIQSWVEYVELRFDINNCRTLCAKCHYQITFGKPMPESVQGWGHNLLRGGAFL